MDVLSCIFRFRDCICVLRGRRNESVIAWLGCLAFFVSEQHFMHFWQGIVAK